MIEGISILSQSPIFDYSPFFIICMSAFFVSLLFIILSAIQESLAGVIIFVIIFVLSFGLSLYSTKDCKPSGKYTYKVTISENVKMNEFLDKYIIIKQEGKIYTIKERSQS